MMHYGFWGRPEMGWWGWGIGSVFSVIFWILLILLLFSLFRHRSGREEERDSRALDILKERYAKGEISRKEFEDMKKDIS